MTGEAIRQMDAGTSLRIFRPIPGDAHSWTDDPEVPEAAIGFTDEYLFGVFAREGMEVRTVVPGEWWTHRYAQDLFVAVRR